MGIKRARAQAGGYASLRKSVSMQIRRDSGDYECLEGDVGTDSGRDRTAFLGAVCGHRQPFIAMQCRRGILEQSLCKIGFCRSMQ
jgi:hypothetical protein